MRFRRRSDPDQLELNLIPLIDVLLVVLIFLAASSSFVQTTHINVQLPQAQSGMATKHELLIAIDQQGNYAIGETWLPHTEHQQLKQILTAQLAQQEAAAMLLLADDHAPHGAVIRLMDAARQAGVADISFATRSQP